MKKILLSLLMISLIFVLATTVNAATISVNPTTVTTGNNTTVDINISQTVYSMELKITYDEDLFDYVSNSTGTTAVVNATTPGELILSYATTSGTNSISLNFKSKSAGTGQFVVTESSFFDNSGNVITSETFTTTTVSVVVESATISNTTNNTTNNSVINTVDKLPQTGTNWIPYLVIATLLLGIIAFNYKRKK